MCFFPLQIANMATAVIIQTMSHTCIITAVAILAICNGKKLITQNKIKCALNKDIKTNAKKIKYSVCFTEFIHLVSFNVNKTSKRLVTIKLA